MAVIFVGDDWAEDHHEIHLMDAEGARLASRRLPDGLVGIRGFHELVAAHAEEPSQVVVGIETDRGLWVDALTAATTATLRDATNWDEVVTKLGYEQLKRHSLRHTGLTWMADAGVPVHVLRKIAGHADLSTTQRYLHPDRQSVAGAGELLSKHLWSQNGPKLRVV